MIRAMFLASLVLLLPRVALADVPSVVGHQGVLVLPGERIPRDGSLDLSFAIFDRADGGTKLYEALHLGVPVRRGMYNVMLEDGVQSLQSAFADGGLRFLETTITSAPLDPDLNGATLSPRQVIGPLPYALRAARAQHLVADGGQGVPRGAMVVWDQPVGCDGGARRCPCGFDEAGEFRGRTARAADRLAADVNLPDQAGVTLGDPEAEGRFGDRLGATETPSHVHDHPDGPVHSHRVSDQETAYFWGSSDPRMEIHSDHRIGSSASGSSSQDGAHRHEMVSAAAEPHLHPFRTVLFCRKE